MKTQFDLFDQDAAKAGVGERQTDLESLLALVQAKEAEWSRSRQNGLRGPRPAKSCGSCEEIDMENEINELLEVIKADYIKWKARCYQSMGRAFDPDSDAQVKEFCETVSFSVGKSYIKIIQKGSAWGFVVKTDNDKAFKRGDILKPANWASPARNRARGNVIEKDFSWVQWTGPAYIQ
jgi:hypothetical protein